MVLYAVLGIVGLPVFSDASSGFGIIAGPTGGYIIGFIFAAAFTGWLAQRSWDRKILRAIAAFLGGTVVTFAFGLPWLAMALGLNLEQTLAGRPLPVHRRRDRQGRPRAGIITLAWNQTLRSADPPSLRFEPPADPVSRRYRHPGVHRPRASGGWSWTESP